MRQQFGVVLGIRGEDEATRRRLQGVKQDLAGEHGFAGAGWANDNDEGMGTETAGEQQVQARNAGGQGVGERGHRSLSAATDGTGRAAARRGARRPAQTPTGAVMGP